MLREAGIEMNYDEDLRCGGKVFFFVFIFFFLLPDMYCQVVATVCHGSGKPRYNIPLESLMETAP